MEPELGMAVPLIHNLEDEHTENESEEEEENTYRTNLYIGNNRLHGQVCNADNHI